MSKTGAFLRKPLRATFAELSDDECKSNGSSQNNSYDSISSDSDDASIPSSTRKIQRHLTLFDLVNIGVGGTIGSGIFVLCGFIAKNYAGPATCISWLISGIAATLSGVCYAELACRMPAAGSSYAYVYSSMGELPAMLAAACLTLEYLISAAAVARSWGDKMIIWLSENIHLIENEEKNFLNPGYNFNPLAALVSTASVVLLMNGVKESKAVTNFFTVTKITLVIFMAVFGLIIMKPRENLTPFIPQQLGLAGIFRGATSSFFGFIGFDEVACMAKEAVDPQKNMPLAIMCKYFCRQCMILSMCSCSSIHIHIHGHILKPLKSFCG
jgi:APA family basic amino acid/polyamine antiporter